MSKHPKAAAGEVALFGRGHWHHTSRLFGALSLQQQQPPSMAATAHRSLRQRTHCSLMVDGSTPPCAVLPSGLYPTDAHVLVVVT